MENRRGKFTFAALAIEGTTECPRCQVPYKPHLGNLIQPDFKCESCKVKLTLRECSTGRATRCPCCHFPRYPPGRLTMIVCGGCEATVICRRSDGAVKCYLCNHITSRPVANSGVNRFVSPFLNRIVPPRVNRMSRVVNPETESTATSAFTPWPESPQTSVADSVAQIPQPENPDPADSVAQIVENVALGNRTTKRESEEDKTEPESKKIRRH